MEYKLDPDSRQAPYEQIVDAMRQAIIRGEFPPGCRLPSRPVLAQMYGVARMTVDRAYQTLIAEDLIVARQGVGTFVRTSKDIPVNEIAPMADADNVARISVHVEHRLSRDQLVGLLVNGAALSLSGVPEVEMTQDEVLSTAQRMLTSPGPDMDCWPSQRRWSACEEWAERQVAKFWPSESTESS